MSADSTPSAGMRISQASEFHVRIQSRQYFDYQGDLNHPYSDMHIAFAGILDLFQHMWDLLDEYNYPKATNRSRHWNTIKPQSHREETDTMKRKPVKANDSVTGGPSFLIKVHFRQNTTWQGTIQWLEKEQTLPFRSTLELIRLMDDVVSLSMPEEEQDKDGSGGEDGFTV